MPELTPQEAAHAASILAPNPDLKPIPPAKVTRILVGVPVRKPPEVLQYLVQTLAWQRLRTKCEVSYVFVPNFGGEPWQAASLNVLQTAKLANLAVWDNTTAPDGDYGEATQTRQWTQPAFQRLAALKNRILQHALNTGADFVWLLDADVMCDPGTLQSLLDAADHEHWLMYGGRWRTPIVSAVYWTRWQRVLEGDTAFVHAGPQVWLVPPYKLEGRGWTEGQFRGALVRRQRVKVGGLGACTLIPVDAIRHGVSFVRHESLPPGPMSEGEDRHFCAWATEKHVPLVADAWPDIWHAYHPQEYASLSDHVAALRYEPKIPAFGDLVSGKVEMLEPVADSFGRTFVGLTRWIRGRLGSFAVLPQIEETLARLVPGDTRIVKLHFPLDWPEAQLRLHSIVARITLLDAKLWRLAPVVDEEHFVGDVSGALIDTTQHRAEQLQEIAGL